MPTFVQVFVAGAGSRVAGMALERQAFCLRKRAEKEADVYFPSLSSRTLVYKGMLTTDQLDHFFPDLTDPRLASALAVVHSRFSTNTFPSWPLAHPFRFIAHNGEINTVMGNRNWMRAREALLASDLIPGDLERLYPICTPGASDSASFDEVLELLHLGGRSLPHSVLMMIPEAWENHAEMDARRRAFYEFHSTLMEPWDGPAAVVFTDGSQIGAVLDRNGLRPSRYWVTDDGLVVLASEVGVLDLDPATIIRKGRLQPGRMFLVDTDENRIIEDEEIKSELAAEHPYDEWLHAGIVHLPDVPEREHIVHTHASVTRRQQIFGYTEEELRVLLTPMANTGAEPIGSMGTDSPIAALSDKPRMLFDYFSQLFAQVTNPPLDAIREELVTSLAGGIGPEANLLDPTPASCRQVLLPFPVFSNDDLAKIRHINRDGDMPGFATHVARGLYDVEGGGPAMAARLDEICAEISAAIAEGARIIVLSDRHSTAELAPIPSLLLTGAVHHHLVREKTRTQVGLLVEAGDVREVHHVALLIGYGAAAVNPYLAMESVEDLARDGFYVKVEPEVAVKHIVKALGKGVLKVMSKMGVSTVASYTGAQIFEAIGISQDVVDRYFTGTTSKLGGIGLDVIAEEVARRHATAYPRGGISPAHRELAVGGEYQWRREGEPHLFDPETVFRLQHATRAGRYDIFKQYTARVDDQAQRLMTLRGLFRFKEPQDGRRSIDIDEVEPVASIVRRFSTGAMSYGSISQEAHETLAIAMNSIGAKSNTGEGGEDSDRLHDPSRRSSIKQVASGRFGVTSEYLTNADDIQIKMAQGAKPGEGGQLPGHKVYPWVARTRYSTPGVGLISPPPHHDIYSIEDLKQLIHDLKNANPRARVHVKLVAEVGVGTVAAGVSKAHADVVLISGHDGGTGASPLTSLKHAGGPWELGLAETQQTLLLNGLRDRIVVQTDGQLKTGRDVVIAALLGAEEYGFATAPLVVSGCIMMRVCHLDTCPVGVATQNPVLRERFSGRPEFVVTFFEYIAQEVRELLAELGFRTLDEAIGRVDALDVAEAVEPLEGERPGPDPGAAPPGVRGGLPRPGPALHQDPGPRPRQGARQRAGRAGRGRARARRAGAGRLAGAQREPHGRHDPRSRGDQEVRRRRPARRHHRPDVHGVGGPVVRRLRAARHHPAARGRRQRLPRQGALGRADHPPPRPRRDVQGRGADHRRQRHRVRRDGRRDLHPRRRGGAVLRPQLRRDSGGRGRGRPRLRVHDRRPRRRARRDRPQLRRRHVGRVRLRARPRRGPGQRRAGRARPGRGRHGRGAARPAPPPPRGDRLGGRRGAAGRLAGRAGALHRGDAERLQAGHGGEGRGHRGRARRPRGGSPHHGGAAWLTPRAS